MIKKLKRYFILWILKQYKHDSKNCLHSILFLKLVVPEHCYFPGSLTGFYKCNDCGQKFRSKLTPLQVVVKYGNKIMEETTEKETNTNE